MARYPDLRYLFGGPSRSNLPISEACWLARLLKLRTERRWQYVGAAFAFRLAPLSRCESVKNDGFDMSYRNLPSNRNQYRD